MSAPYTPNAANALSRTYPGRQVVDSIVYTEYNPAIASAKYIGYEIMNEILALWQASVASKEYQQVYNCSSGLVDGDPCYIDSNNHVAKADATTQLKSRCVGFAIKITTTTCFLEHFKYVSGLTGLIANTVVFLTNASSYANSPGTAARIVGCSISTTEVLLFASPALAFFLSSNQQRSITTITGVVTLDNTYDIVQCNSATPFTQPLPAVATNSGLVLNIKNINLGIVTLDPNGSETIDGILTLDLNQYEAATLCCDGTRWSILG